MSKQQKLKDNKEKEKKRKAKTNLQLSVNESIRKCAYCGIKDKNTVYYNGHGFCDNNHLELWKERRK